MAHVVRPVYNGQCIALALDGIAVHSLVLFVWKYFLLAVISTILVFSGEASDGNKGDKLIKSILEETVLLPPGVLYQWLSR